MKRRIFELIFLQQISANRVHAQRLSEMDALNENAYGPGYGGGDSFAPYLIAIIYFCLTYLFMRTLFKKLPPELSWVPAALVSALIIFAVLPVISG